jgi:hypothetical protein
LDCDLSNTEAPGPEPRNRFKTLLDWLAGASALLHVLSRFVPWAPPDASKYSEIDLSWLQFLHQAFLERLQCGRDLIFTFGPWGFLYGGYYPGTRLVSVLVWSVLSLIFWWAGWKAARRLTRNLLGAWIWLISFTSVAGAALPSPNIDTRLYAFVFLLLLFHFFVEDKPLTIAQAALTVALALLSLIKVSLLALALAMLAFVVADIVWRRKRFPWIAPLFVGSLLVFWLIAGQRLDSVIPFLINSRRLTGGYSEAMALTQPTDLRDALCFLLAAVIPCGLWGYAAWMRRRFFGLLPAAGLGLMLFTIFKYDCVRRDSHEAASALELMLVSLGVLVAIWPFWRTTNRRLALAGLLQVAVILCFARIPFNRHDDRGLFASLAQGLSARKILGPAQLLAGEARVRENFDTYVATSKAGRWFPRIQGSVDVYPWSDTITLPEGAHYSPRPIMQSYTAYTPALAELNAERLRHDRAPDYVVFRPNLVDLHCPGMDDGPSWPEILTRYDVTDVELPFLVLHRSKNPRLWKLIPIEDRTVHAGEFVPLPPFGQSPIWAQIDMDKNLGGVLKMALYKAPIIVITAQYKDGRQQSFRLVPGMARSGFVLSPLIGDTLAFAALSSGEHQRLTQSELVSFMVSGNGEQQLSGYRPDMRLRLFRLEFPPHPMANSDDFRRICGLTDILPHSQLLYANRGLEMAFWPETGTVLAVPANSELQVVPSGRPRRLRLGFGLAPLENANSQTTNGVEFRVSSKEEGSEPVSLWSRRLSPAAQESDRGAQRAVIDLTDRPASKFLLQILPGSASQNGTLSVYWSEIQFE